MTDQIYSIQELAEMTPAQGMLGRVSTKTDVLPNVTQGKLLSGGQSHTKTRCKTSLSFSFLRCTMTRWEVRPNRRTELTRQSICRAPSVQSV